MFCLALAVFLRCAALGSRSAYSLPLGLLLGLGWLARRLEGRAPSRLVSAIGHHVVVGPHPRLAATLHHSEKLLKLGWVLTGHPVLMLPLAFLPRSIAVRCILGPGRGIVGGAAFGVLAPGANSGRRHPLVHAARLLHHQPIGVHEGAVEVAQRASRVCRATEAHESHLPRSPISRLQELDVGDLTLTGEGLAKARLRRVARQVLDAQPAAA
mmetsp:Transcript_32320/g.80945  ORF Transcript_32320/g.80945 Transcript_32320/m.80945 type:complete len:212 (+) Transcript_32320:2222-2857(+)